MFDFGYSELLIVAVVLLVVVGPKELPGLLKIIFDFVSKIKVYASELRTGVQTIANDLEVEKISKKNKNSINKNSNDKININD
ncbi:MAG: twin-arginine translocase subunit TatB [Rhizobiales bacterium TMED168]|nr:MAG: twin-arginine translocase subunit TatB [Rhizobiales bacterium TMED168]|tara:strand:+ start:39260 stop:39508 length:249 start_codon:yes stop_codon:yes gene_type:complete